jgi:hypothetical protein
MPGAQFSEMRKSAPTSNQLVKRALSSQMSTSNFNTPSPGAQSAPHSQNGYANSHSTPASDAKKIAAELIKRGDIVLDLAGIFCHFPQIVPLAAFQEHSEIDPASLPDTQAGHALRGFLQIPQSAPRAKDGGFDRPAIEVHLEAWAAQTKTHAPEISQSLPRDVTADNAASIAAILAAHLSNQQNSEYEIFSFEDMAKLPRPKWLIRGALIEKTASMVSADTGNFKSFFAFEAALCIATGRPFFGRDVQQGAVVYVAAEGFYTLYDRAAAWAQFHDCELPKNFHILRMPINMADAGVVVKFAATIAPYAPIFVVLDTLSQCAVGANENDNGEMAGFVRGMMALGRRIGAHVQVLHHNAKSTGTFRGAGSIKANVDTHITLDRPDGDEENTVFVRNEKQRGKTFEAFALRGQEVTLPYADEYGEAITSLVFEECGDAVTAKAKHASTKKAEETRERLMEIFDVVAIEGAPYGGVKRGFWQAEVDKDDPPICQKSAFFVHVKALEKSGVIRECGTHKGSQLYERVRHSAIPVMPETESRKAGNQPFHHSGCALAPGMSESSPESTIELPEMPTKTTRKTESAAASAEPYTTRTEGNANVGRF